MNKILPKGIIAFNFLSIIVIFYVQYQLLFNYGIDAHDEAWSAATWFSKTNSLTWSIIIISIGMLLINTIYLIIREGNKRGIKN